MKTNFLGMVVLLLLRATIQAKYVTHNITCVGCISGISTENLLFNPAP